MCGICGMISPYATTSMIEGFTELLAMSSFRGHDSYGVFQYGSSGPFTRQNYRLNKGVGSAAEFIGKEANKSKQDRVINSIYADVLFGHARWATKGKVTRENAHPFDTGRYVSMHNGTLRDKRFIHKDKTDSQVMFETMEEEGILPVLSSLTSDDAFAVAIFDKEKKTITLSRNAGRPLFVGIGTDSDVLYFASELSMLHLIAARKREPLYETIDLSFYKLLPNQAYTISLNKIRKKNFTPWIVDEWTPPKPDWHKKYESLNVTTETAVSSIINDPIVSGSTKGLTDFFDTCEECSTCGDLLYGVDLQRAVPLTVSGQTLWTCKTCQKDFDGFMAKETKSA